MRAADYTCCVYVCSVNALSCLCFASPLFWLDLLRLSVLLWLALAGLHLRLCRFDSGQEGARLAHAGLDKKRHGGKLLDNSKLETDNSKQTTTYVHSNSQSMPDFYCAALRCCLSGEPPTRLHFLQLCPPPGCSPLHGQPRNLVERPVLAHVLALEAEDFFVQMQEEHLLKALHDGAQLVRRVLGRLLCALHEVRFVLVQAGVDLLVCVYSEATVRLGTTGGNGQ